MRRLLLILVALVSAGGGPLAASAGAVVPRITPGQSANSVRSIDRFCIDGNGRD